MSKCKKLSCFFKSKSFLTKNASKESTDSGENGKYNLFVSQQTSSTTTPRGYFLV